MHKGKLMFCEGCGVYIHNNACGCDEVEQNQDISADLKYWENVLSVRKRMMDEAQSRVDELKKKVY